MSTKLSKSDFDFRLVNHGIWEVRYITPLRGDYYINLVTDAELIDATMHEDYPKQTALKQLRNATKGYVHRNKDGKALD